MKTHLSFKRTSFAAIRWFSSVTLGMVLIKSASLAAVYTETVTVAPAALRPASLSFNLPTFNTGLGTLNSVDLILTPIFGDFGYSVYNMGAVQTVGSAKVSNPHGGFASSVAGLNGTWSSPGTAQRDVFEVNSGFNNGSLPFTFTASTMRTSLSAAEYAALVTPLLVTANGTADSSGSPGGGGTLFYGWFGNIGGSLDAIYDFTPVPEPASAAGIACMALLGLAGYQSVRRARK